MKMHLAWIRVTAAAATTIASVGGQIAVGQSQYGPYATTPYSAPQTTAPQYQTQPYSPTQYTPPTQTTPPRYTTTVAPYGVQPSQQLQQAPAVAVQPTQTSAYPTTSAPTYYSAARAPYSPAPTQSTPSATGDRYAMPATAAPAQVTYQPPQHQAAQYQAPQYQAPQYQQPGARPTYPMVAQHSHGNVTPGTPEPAGESLPTPAPAMNDPAAQGYGLSSGGAPVGGYPAGNCGCNTDTFDDQGYGLDPYMDDCEGGSQWFGGVYGLYMTRSQPSYRPYTAGVDSVATGTPYYPQPGDVENMSDCTYLVPDWREGVEVRLGCAFAVGDGCDYGDCGTGCGPSGCGGNDPCGCQPSCQPCCQQMYAWEVAWWGIDRDVQDQFVDGPLTANFRYYGMINYAGLEYDPGTGAQSVNDFYNYQVPITGPGAETVLSQRVRTNFSAQNLELNMLRLPLMVAGCGCDGCEPFSITGLCGVRYFTFDDDFEFATEWDDGNALAGWRNGTNELFHDIQMENQLLGFQLGANMNYRVASRWNFFWDTNFGLYNNHINQYQRMYNPLLGNVVFAQDTREFSVMSTKNEVAFLGEMRLGGGFLITQHWRGILAYRAIAISGVALAPDQIRPEYNSWTDTARINADSSIFIHGAQVGIECNF